MAGEAVDVPAALAASIAADSLAEQVAELSQEDRELLLKSFTDEEIQRLLYEWWFWCRENQRRPEGLDWWCWLLLGGRGMGKTRSGSECVRSWAEEARDAGRPQRFALVGQTAGDVRDVMLEGESGILTISPPWWRPHYVAGTRSLTWPDGTVALLFSGDKPNQLRGPQFHKAWVDEPAKYQYPEETWDNLELCLRLGEAPQVVATTTPRPIPLVRRLVKEVETGQTRLSHGSTLENMANLSPRYIKRVVERFVGTRLGRQEIFAEVLLDTPGAMWTLARLDANRIRLERDEKGEWHHRLPEFARVVVGVDPAASSEEHSNETGITVGAKGVNGHGYCLADRSGIFSPADWGRRAVEAYHEFKADRIVAEANNGGEMVRHTIHSIDSNVPVRLVHASRGKAKRAEPISSFDEQGKIHHVGTFADLEDQLIQLTPDSYMGKGSPDRADSYVWTFTALLIGASSEHDPDEWPTVRY